MPTIGNLRKRRGVVRGSITRLATRLRELEEITDQPRTADHASQLLAKLESLDGEFKAIHFEIIDLIDESEDLEKEQTVLDKHDDDVSTLTIRLQALSNPKHAKIPSTVDIRKPISRKLTRLEKGLKSIDDIISTDAPERSMIQQCSEQLSDYKGDLTAVYEELLSKDIDDDDELATFHSKLEKILFDISQRVKQLSIIPVSESTSASTSTPDGAGSGVRLPKLNVPTFDGNIVHWKQFWDQFNVAVHSKPGLSDAEKTVYLQNAIKDGSARNAIEGLSHSGDNYKEAIECLKSRYDRPRLIQRTHVQLITDAPCLRDGSGKEIRALHDTIQQHVRALKTLGCDLPGNFITSMIELKLDVDTLFEWQKHSQSSAEVPPYQELLHFLDLRAQASETSGVKKTSRHEYPRRQPNKAVSSFISSAGPADKNCVACKKEKHPLYVCSQFKALSHEEKMSVLRDNNLCRNCLQSGHFQRKCKSNHKCKVCQKPHHTLLHVESRDPAPETEARTDVTCSHAAAKLRANTLLMTCRVLIVAPDGSSVEVRALLDNASTASFVSERLVQSLSLPRTNQSIRVSGIGGISHKAPIQSITSFRIKSVRSSSRAIEVDAVIIPRVSCDLPTNPISFDSKWKHLSELTLADPNFGQPGRIDLLLGVDVFMDILRDGRRKGPPGSPTAFETDFGWILGGSTGPLSISPQTNFHVLTFHTTALSDDDVLRKFWEVEESFSDQACLSAEERAVIHHFDSNHKRSREGRFIVPLPKDPNAQPLGESRSQAVKRFFSLERSLNAKGRFPDFDAVMREYLELGHAEIVPAADLEKSPESTFYLPMHAVYKASSSTTRIRAVFDASARSSTGVSLNDTLLVGPTMHPPLVDVLLRFRLHPVALTADISKMYRAVELADDDKDLHRYVWRSDPNESLKDYRMTRVTFGVSASSFAANMSVKQNAIDYSHECPMAAEVVKKAFYVDDCLTGAADSKSALTLQQQLTELFSRGGFVLRKWNSNDPSVLEKIPDELRDSREVQAFHESAQYSKTLGIEWNVSADQFHLSITDPPSENPVTKRNLVSDVAKVFDALGLFSPIIIKMKIVLQRLWELKLDWDDPVPAHVLEIWSQWRRELLALTTVHIPRCYSPVGFTPTSVELHGFSDASEEAYARVVYIRLINSSGRVHTTLVMSKTRVAPVKRLSIPRLELCGAQLLTKLLCHVKRVLEIPMSSVIAWTDSTVVLSWLTGNPRRFKTYVGNRVSFILDQIPPDRWKHVPGILNPADCASRGLFPLQLKDHHLWWNGPQYLQLDPSLWPEQPASLSEITPAEEKKMCNLTTITQTESLEPIIPNNRFSSFIRLKRIVAWIHRFVHNLRCSVTDRRLAPHLMTTELSKAEDYWVAVIQRESFPKEIDACNAETLSPRIVNSFPFDLFGTEIVQ